MRNSQEFNHWPIFLDQSRRSKFHKYTMKIESEEKAFLKSLFPDVFILEVAARYSFDPKETRFRRALFAATQSFLRSTRLKHRRKTGQAAQAQELRKERHRVIEEFIELFDIEPDYNAFLSSPPENPTLLKLERLVLEAIKHQDKERALSEVSHFHKELSTFDEDIAEMSFIAEHYATTYNPPSLGRPINSADFRFVAVLADFWSEELSRAITLDTYKGEGLTEAFKFVQDCAAPINAINNTKIGKLSSSQITTMIRKYRTEKPNWEKNLQKYDGDQPL